MKRLLLLIIFAVISVSTFAENYRYNFIVWNYRRAPFSDPRRMVDAYQLDKKEVRGTVDLEREYVYLDYYDEKDNLKHTSFSIPKDNITEFEERSNYLNVKYNNGHIHIEIDDTSITIGRTVGNTYYVWWGFIRD